MKLETRSKVVVYSISYSITQYEYDIFVITQVQDEAEDNNKDMSQRTILINGSFVAGITNSGLWLCLTIKVSFGCVNLSTLPL